jgi:hypothetical protein
LAIDTNPHKKAGRRHCLRPALFIEPICPDMGKARLLRCKPYCIGTGACRSRLRSDGNVITRVGVEDVPTNGIPFSGVFQLVNHGVIRSAFMVDYDRNRIAP